jgi:hypothetical protein
MGHRPEHMAAIAQFTAAGVGCEAVRWWPDAGDPYWIRIEARLCLPQDTARTVRLLAFLGLEGAQGLVPPTALCERRLSV